MMQFPHVVGCRDIGFVKIVEKSWKYDKISELPPLYWWQEGGACMEFILSFLVAVVAGVACHYIIKWLDGDK